MSYLTGPAVIFVVAGAGEDGTRCAPAGLKRFSRVGGTPTYSTVVGNTNVSDGGWTQLTAPWQLAGDVSFVTVYVESASTLSDFYIDDFSMTYIPTLHGLLTCTAY